MGGGCARCRCTCVYLGVHKCVHVHMCAHLYLHLLFFSKCGFRRFAHILLCLCFVSTSFSLLHTCFIDRLTSLRSCCVHMRFASCVLLFFCSCSYFEERVYSRFYRVCGDFVMCLDPFGRVSGIHAGILPF